MNQFSMMNEAVNAVAELIAAGLPEDLAMEQAVAVIAAETRSGHIPMGGLGQGLGQVITNVGNNAVVIDTVKTPPGTMTLAQAKTAINNLTAYVAWYNSASGRWSSKSRAKHNAGPNSPAQVAIIIADIYKALNVNAGIRAANILNEGKISAADKRYIDSNIALKPASLQTYIDIHAFMDTRVADFLAAQAKAEQDARDAAAGKAAPKIAESYFTWDTIFGYKQYADIDTTAPVIAALKKGYPSGVPVSEHAVILKVIDDENYAQGVMRRKIADAQNKRIADEAELQRLAKLAEDKRIADEAAKQNRKKLINRKRLTN